MSAYTIDGTTADPQVLTFLIADVRGYTRFTRERGDAAAAELAKRFADLARDAVEARSGEVLELRGDEALAVFESPAQAVLAAVEFQATCAEETEADPELPLPVGIGIDRGQAVPVEDGYRGVAINMAARLCSAAGAGEVLTTTTVARSGVDADGAIHLVERGPASFKGFDQSVDVLEVLAAWSNDREPEEPAARESRDAIAPELDPLTPLVDRDHEMRWLRGTWRQARRGRGRVLFVSGPAQIGKTRLAGEIGRHVEASGGVTRYAGPGGAATAIALSEIRTARSTSVPTLVVLDDIDVVGSAVAEELLASFDALSTRPVLVLALLRDRHTAVDLAPAIDWADERGDGHRILGPLDADGVRGIVRLYVGEADREAPIESLARASQGVPGRVHEVVSEWSQSEASRRLAAASEFLAAGRERHASDLEFANNVIGLKLGRLYTIEGRDVPATETCPYRGLAQFNEGDAAFFFGRERLVGELAARTVQVGLLGVVGASGSGKSSVIAAGLLPSLRAGLLPGSERWRQISMRPGEHPLDELRTALATDAEDPLTQLIEETAVEERLVLVVDQFEETFTVCADEEERGAFVGSLIGAAKRWPDRVVVILAIRGDYYGHCASYRDLAEELSANHVLVGPLTREELRRAIALPARRAGFRVESALEDALAEEVADEPGGLPLLSTCLVELWAARDGRWIRMDAYAKTGGVRGAVSRLAESSYSGLSESEREAVRRVFLRLVATGEGETLTRRRVPMKEFDLERDAVTAGMLVRLTQDRLLTMSEDTVEVAHEALLREWPRLLAWLDADAQGRQLRLHLTQTAKQWQLADREPSELYRGARLSAALDWSNDHLFELNDAEHEFLNASRRAGERDADRQRRANRRLRGLLAGVAGFLVLTLIAGTLALVQRGNARRSAVTAQLEATDALAQSLGAQAVSEPRIDRAMLLAREAVALDPSARTRSDLLTTLLRVPTVIRTLHWNGNRNVGVAVSPDGKTVAIEDNDGHTVVENASTGGTIGTISASILGFGPDGSLLTSGNTPRVDVRDPADLSITRSISIPTPIRGPNTTVVSTFTGGGGRLAALIEDQTPSPTGPVTTAARIVQYDYASGHPTAATIAVSASTTAAAYVDRARRMVIVSSTRTDVVDAGTGHPIGSFPVGGGVAAISADGRMVAIGGADGAVRFLDLATGHVSLGIGAQGGGVATMGFTPDGGTLITSGDDGTTDIWDVSSRTIRTTLTGHAGPIHAQAITQDGSTLYTGGFDSNVLAWDLSGGRGLAPTFQAAVTNPALQAWSLAVSPDGRIVAVGSTTGKVSLWDITTLSEVRAFQAVPGLVAALAFSPDGRSLLVAGDSPQPGQAWLRVWGLGARPVPLRSMQGVQHITWAAWSPDGSTIAATGTQLGQDPTRAGVVAEWDASTGQPLGRPFTVNGGEPVDVSFAPSGKTVAVSGVNGFAEVLDPATGAVESRFSVGGLYTLGVAFSPDGTEIATAGWGGSVDLWNPKSGKRIGAPIVDPGQDVVASVAWSPDGRTLAITDWGEALRLFDVRTHRELGPPVQLGASASAQTDPYVAFTPNGSNVVVADATGRAWVVPASLRGWELHACAVAGRNLTRTEWTEFLPGLAYRATCARSQSLRSERA